MIKAVIFDMDGVLVDSERVFIDYLAKFFEINRVLLDKEKLYYLVGTPANTDDVFVAEKLNMNIDEARKIKDQFFIDNPIRYGEILKDYVKETLDYLKKHSIKIALASSSSMKSIERALGECKIEDYFCQIVSGEMFKESKPNPEIYEYSVSRLGLDKKEIIVVEDSCYGVCSAKAAGLKVCAINDPLFNFDLSKADYKVNSLKEFIDIMKEQELC